MPQSPLKTAKIEDEQAQDDRWSIPAQKRAIEEGCTRRGWVIVGWVYDDDSAHSDSIAKRPGLKGLMEAVENGTLGADAIVVHSLDRWARNVLVMLGTLAILGKKNIGWLSLEENIDYSTPIGMFLLTMIATFAQFYSDQLSFHTKKGKRERALEGYYNGQLAFGYATPVEGKSGQHNKAIPATVPAQIGWYITARDWYRPSTGPGMPEGEAATFAEVARRLNEAGVRVINRWTGKDRWATRNPHQLWTGDTVAHMLKNRFYCGLVQHDGDWYEGKHAAVSTEEMIDEIIAKAARNSNGRPPKATPSGRIYLLNRRMLCAACSDPLDIHGVGDKVRFVCTARKEARDCAAEKRSVKQEVFEEHLATVIDALQLPPAYRERALEMLGQIDPQSDEARILKRRDALLAELERCKHTYKIGVSPQAEFDADVRRIQYELAGLPPLPSIERRTEVLDEAAALLDNIGRLWREIPRAHQRDLAQTLFRGVSVDLDRGNITQVDLDPSLQDLLPLIGIDPEQRIGAPGTEGSVSGAPSARHSTPYETTDGQGTELSAPQGDTSVAHMAQTASLTTDRKFWRNRRDSNPRSPA